MSLRRLEVKLPALAAEVLGLRDDDLMREDYPSIRFLRGPGMGPLVIELSEDDARILMEWIGEVSYPDGEGAEMTRLEQVACANAVKAIKGQLAG